MGNGGSEVLDPPAPVDSDLAEMTDRETKLGFATDAFPPTDFKGAVFLHLGDPTGIFLLSRSTLNSLYLSTTYQTVS